MSFGEERWVKTGDFVVISKGIKDDYNFDYKISDTKVYRTILKIKEVNNYEGIVTVHVYWRDRVEIWRSLDWDRNIYGNGILRLRKIGKIK
jgi:hypothetical protein